MTLSVMAANIEGQYTGVSHKANYLLYLTEDNLSEYRIEEYNWTFAAERADSAGADVINSSLAYHEFDDESMNYQKSQIDGKTAVVSQAAQKAFERGIIVVNSAGNAGETPWVIIKPPADAIDILAIGSISPNNILSSTSSQGPTADNRIKPDLVAIGDPAQVVLYETIGGAHGTSFSSPLVAGLMAGLRQKYPDLSASQLVDFVKKSADQAINPDNKRGYGIPSFTAVQNYIEAKQNNETKLEVYPNPITGNKLMIKFKEANGENTELRFFDSQGKLTDKLTYYRSWVNNPFEYDLSNYQSGLYIMKIRVGETITTIKFVKL